MNRFGSWIASSLGYLLYTALVLLGLLWWLFPAEPLRIWLLEKLNTATPSYQWEVDELHAAWPVGVVVSKIRLLDEKGSETQLVQVDTLRVTPDFKGLLRMDGQIPVQYDLKVFDGTVRGNMSLIKDSGRIVGEGVIEDIELGTLSEVWQKMNRSVSGRMSGTYGYDVLWPDLRQGNGHLDLTVYKGTIGLQQPVFNLSQLEFSEMAVALQLENKVVTLDGGRVKSKMLGGGYNGTVVLRTPLFMSEIKVDGFIEPRPELLGLLQDKVTVELIKDQLQDNKLSFAISGTLMEPGILFQGVSGVIDGIIQGSGR